MVLGAAMQAPLRLQAAEEAAAAVAAAAAPDLLPHSDGAGAADIDLLLHWNGRLLTG